MTTDDLFITYVLDRSGSMMNIWKDVLGGLNSYIEEQKKEQGKTWFTLTTFDTVVETPFRAWNVNDLPKITDRHATPRGGTALLDAVGAGVSDAEKWLTENPWFEGRTLVAIMTDGEENSSKEYTKEKLKALITEKEKAGWTIAYMGANQDSWSVAGGLGIAMAATMDWAATSAGTQQVYASVTRSTSSLRKSGVYNDDGK